MQKGKNLRLVDTTYDAICASLSSGLIKPGDWLRQVSLAEELNISQATVRDALNRMVGDGLALRIPRKGVRVPNISPEDLKDIYEIRIMLEGSAWQAAAENITAEELDQMRKILPLTGTTSNPQSVNIARQNNQEFHMIAINASGRWILIRFLSQLLNFNNFRYLLTSSSEEIRVNDGEKNVIEHESLLKALEKRDADLSKELIVNHIRRSMTDRLSLYGKILGPE